MTVRVRGIYATALTVHLENVVQASPVLQDRVDESIPMATAAARVETTDDRQGVGVHGDPERVDQVTERLAAVGRDALSWEGALPVGAIYAGEVTDTLGSGAVVAVDDGEGWLPYGETARRIEEGDRLRVQVADPAPPWADHRSVLSTDVRIERGLGTIVRGGASDARGPELADVLPTEPPEGWGMRWAPEADDAGLDALGETLDALATVATDVDDALADADPPADAAPGPYWAGEATRWVWFGRESRFALDEIRDDLTATMSGHHRIKAGSDAASAAVDFVEAVCPGPGAGDRNGDPGEGGGGGGDRDAADPGHAKTGFPFDAVTRQFGPTVGDSVRIAHGKPNGDLYDLGPGEVVERGPAGSVTIRREMAPGGTYDALGIEREAGDVAVTEITEGRWWYPTVYRSDDGERRGTYVNVCTPVEVFPSEVRYVDLHVDVVKHGDGTVERVDDDELDAAENRGRVPSDLAERAREVAGAVENAL